MGVMFCVIPEGPSGELHGTSEDPSQSEPDITPGGSCGSRQGRGEDSAGARIACNLHGDDQVVRGARGARTVFLGKTTTFGPEEGGIAPPGTACVLQKQGSRSRTGRARGRSQKM